MKKILLNLLALSLLITSCESDDDNNSSSDLQGTWKLTAWNVANAIDLNGDGTVSTNMLDEMNCYNNETITFGNSTATATTTSYADIEAELVTGSDTEYSYIIDCVSEINSDTATYVVNGNTVTITTTYEEDGETYEDILVATKSGNTLSFVVEEGLYIEESDSFDVVVNQDLTFIYTKQ